MKNVSHNLYTPITKYDLSCLLEVTTEHRITATCISGDQASAHIVLLRDNIYKYK